MGAELAGVRHGHENPIATMAELVRSHGIQRHGHIAGHPQMMLWRRRRKWRGKRRMIEMRSFIITPSTLSLADFALPHPSARGCLSPTISKWVMYML